jgi:hypothetical protein
VNGVRRAERERAGAVKEVGQREHAVVGHRVDDGQSAQMNRSPG